MSALQEERNRGDGEGENLLTSMVVNHPGSQAIHCVSVPMKGLSRKQMNERHKVDKAILFIEPASVGESV